MSRRTKGTTLITKSKLKSERGWTDKLMNSFLPAPDQTKPNPRRRGGRPMDLYDLKTIRSIEQTPSFRSEFIKVEKRKLAAAKASEMKQQELLDWVRKVQIDLPALDQSTLIQTACDSYNAIQKRRQSEGEMTCGLTATPDSDEAFLKRICVNHLRHGLATYQEHLDEMSGKTAFREGQQELRERIFARIAEYYPWLAKECQRQQKMILSRVRK